MKRKTFKNNNNAPKTAKKQEPYTAKQRQFLAYVLAFAMLFWTIASVLGIVGFVKTCKADSQEASLSASSLSAVSVKETSMASDFEQTIDLQFYGVSVPVGLTTNERTFNRTAITFTSQRGGYPYVSIDGVDFSLSTSFNYVGDYYGYDFQGQSINGDYDGVVYYDDDNTVLGVPQPLTYRPPTEYDNGLYVDSVAVDVEVMETVAQPLSYTWQYSFTFTWYTFDGTYKGETMLVVGFGHNAVLSYESVNIVYPSLSKTYYTAEDEIDEFLRLGVFSYADMRYSYNVGYDVGYNVGYDSGAADGETLGYNRGYAEGVDDAGQYTFMSLLTSVIDAPIKAITQMFEFEVLGVNLANFFWSLISVAAVICVIRLFV